MRAPEKKRPSLDVRKLSEFEFGDPEASNDVLLAHCIQRNRGVNEFLSGTKAICVGERGAGKTALFTLLAGGNLEFADIKDTKSKKRVVIPINDELQYLTIRNVIDERFNDNTRRAHGKYRFLWEIYILSRAVECLSESYGAEKEVQQLSEDLGSIFGIKPESKLRIRDLLTAFSIKADVKFDQTGAITPGIKIEKASTSEGLAVPTDKELTELTRRVKQAYAARGLLATVLIDRIDDFVVGDAYDEQRKSVQALVECALSTVGNDLQVKMFLRTDLFERLTFSSGYDKVRAKVTFLKWTSEDIYIFVAKRLFYNYERLSIAPEFSLTHPDFRSADPNTLDTLRSLLRKRVQGLTEAFVSISKMFSLLARIKIQFLMTDARKARPRNLQEDVAGSLITYFFPEKIEHCLPNCGVGLMSTKDFLATHFSLGEGCPNPRLVLLFLDLVFTCSSDYYRQNADIQLIDANPLGEYEVILQEHLSLAYKDLQKIVRKTISDLHPAWKPAIDSLWTHCRRPKDAINLTYADLEKVCGPLVGDADFRSFIAFYSHIGLLVTQDNERKLEDRKFSLPTVVQIC